MKKISILLLLFCIPKLVYAEDCCQNHSGNANICSKEGMIVCNDGFICKNTPCILQGIIPDSREKEETKAPSPVYGCLDKRAKNYNPKANLQDNSCIYYKYGCTDKDAWNYNEQAEKEDGSCIPKIYGCTDTNARNYDSKANISNQKCEYVLIKEIDTEIPYQIEIQKDNTKETYEDKVIQKGITGKVKIKYEIIVNSRGEEQSKKIIEKTVLREAQNKIIKEGNNDTTYHRTIFLYVLSLILFIPVFLYAKRNPHGFFIISIVFSINGKKRSIVYKVVMLFIYLFLTLPIYIDFFLLIKREIEKRV